MRKPIVIAAIALSLILSFQMADSVFFYDDYDFADESVQSSQDENDSVPEDAADAGIIYINTEMDFFSFLVGPGWYYYSYEDMIIFYNYNSLDASSSIAVSSITYSVPEEQRDAQAKTYIQQAEANLEYIINDLQIEQNGNYIFAENTAYWFSYTGSLISGGDAVRGEYMYWWIGDREYTCSMYCSADEYDLFSDALFTLIDNFQQPSKME